MQGGLFTGEDLPQTRLPQKKSSSVQNFSPVLPSARQRTEALVSSMSC